MEAAPPYIIEPNSLYAPMDVATIGVYDSLALWLDKFSISGGSGGVTATAGSDLYAEGAHLPVTRRRALLAAFVHAMFDMHRRAIKSGTACQPHHHSRCIIKQAPKSHATPPNAAESAPSQETAQQHAQRI